MNNHSSKYEYKGWLYKWTNYFKGYQKRWFVLQNGFLSYYRNQSEMGHTCRGTISLTNAKIEAYDSVSLLVSNGSAQTYHLRASSESDRKSWVTVLTQARANALKLAQAVAQDDAISVSLMSNDGTVSAEDFMSGMRTRLGDLETCERMVVRQSELLLRALSDLEDRLQTTASTRDESQRSSFVVVDSVPLSPSFSLFQLAGEDENGTLKEKATMLKVTVNAMMNTLKAFLEYSNGNFRRWQRLLAQEREQRARLERMMEELATQHSALERKVQLQSNAHRHAQHSSSPSGHHEDRKKSFTASLESSNSTLKAESVRRAMNDDEEDDDDENEMFFDAVPGHEDEDSVTFCVTLPASMLPSTIKSTESSGFNQCPSSIPPDNAADESISCYSGSDDEETTAEEEDDYERDEQGLLNGHHKTSTISSSGTSMVRVITRKTSRTVKAASQDKVTYLRHEHRRTGSHGSTASTGESSGDQLVQSRRVQSSIGGEGLHHSLSSASQRLSMVTKDVSYKSSRSTANLQQFSGVLRQRRTMIPPRPNISINLWSIMKNCIGKDLSKIPVPVNFNEPLSMIQRIAEDFEYSKCLDDAARCDPIEQMAYVAAFTVSSYCITIIRTGKPFNPLLGETFECDRREDYGWRLLSEQVSHHPPALACYCESDTWRSWQEFTMSSKFRGKYLSVVPQGISHLTFNGSDNHYTWRKVTTTVHNIIVGRLWIDNHGEMDIYNHGTGHNCHLSYKPYSYFSRDEPRRVMGVIYDKEKTPKYMLRGTWDEYMEGAHITNIRNNDWETGPWTTLWRRNPAPAYADKMYNFTLLAMQLNEMEEGVAPTDSRLRPDQRLMEEGKWDEANKEKERLEEKQRTKRRAREEEARRLGKTSLDGESHEEYEPVWFKPIQDPQSGMKIHMYNGLYWECKERGEWSRCPDIF